MGKLRRMLSKVKRTLIGTPEDKMRREGAIIGKNSHVMNSVIDPRLPFLISIGDNTTVTGATILAHDASTKKSLGYTKIGRVTIGNNCFIGMGSIVLPNVTIGDNVVIGAGSVVTKSIPPNSIAAGNPCRVIKNYDNYMEFQRSRMTDEVVIKKLPAEMSREEIDAIRENIDGIWFIE